MISASQPQYFENGRPSAPGESLRAQESRQPVRQEYSSHHHLSQVMSGLAQIDSALIVAAAALINESRLRDKVIYVVGNGGSAATAAHFCCDLSKGACLGTGYGLKAVSLSDNISLLTAWANDASYEEVYREQLRSWLSQGDTLVALSVSGKSDNVLAAVGTARERHCQVIGIAGNSESGLAHRATLPIVVRGLSTEATEDCHSAICHAIAVELRAQLRYAAQDDSLTGLRIMRSGFSVNG